MKATIMFIENDDDLREATAYASSLMDAETPEDLASLRLQVKLIKEYNARTQPPRERATVPDLLQYLMEQNSISSAEMAELLGARSRLSEIMNGHKRLSLSMIARLSDRFQLSTDLFIEANRRAPEPRPLRKGRPAAPATAGACV